MNSPYMTQRQIEARIASRVQSPEKLRRLLRLDNPQMHGDRIARDPLGIESAPLPTPRYVG